MAFKFTRCYCITQTKNFAGFATYRFFSGTVNIEVTPQWYIFRPRPDRTSRTYIFPYKLRCRHHFSTFPNTQCVGDLRVIQTWRLDRTRFENIACRNLDLVTLEIGWLWLYSRTSAYVGNIDSSVPVLCSSLERYVSDILFLCMPPAARVMPRDWLFSHQCNRGHAKVAVILVCEKTVLQYHNWTVLVWCAQLWAVIGINNRSNPSVTGEVESSIKNNFIYLQNCTFSSFSIHRRCWLSPLSSQVSEYRAPSPYPSTAQIG